MANKRFTRKPSRSAIRGAAGCATEEAFVRHLRRPTREATRHWADVLGEPLYAELQALTLASGRLPRLPASSARVLILPGLMGSSLRHPERGLLWFNPAAILAGELPALSLPEAKACAAESVLPFVYFRLRWRLRAAGFRVDYWPYDWRQAPRLTAQRLLADLRAAALTTPTLLVAHSFGGLVAAHALQADTGPAPVLGRVVTLGTPFAGTPAARAALSGAAPLLRRLAWLDWQHTAPELASSPLSTWPGLQVLCPEGDAALSLGRTHADPRLACIIARNDGTVPLASAAQPAAVGVPVATVRGSHGLLPSLPHVAAVAMDFLRHGQLGPPRTDLPQPTDASLTDGSSAVTPLPVAARWHSLPRAAQWRFLAEWVAPIAGPPPAVSPVDWPVDWHVACGDITQTRADLIILGVSRHVVPAGPLRALKAVDRVREMIAHGLYTPLAGQVFCMPPARSGHPAVLLTGLGDFDRLTPQVLEAAMHQALQLAATLGAKHVATVLLGTASGITPARALRAQQRAILACPTPPRCVTWITRRPARAAWLRRQLGLPTAPEATDKPRRGSAALPAYLWVRQETVARRTLLRMTLLTDRAKAALPTGSVSFDSKLQARILAPLARESSPNGIDTAGKALAEALPPPVRAALMALGETPVVVVHDVNASRWPWETLHVGGATPRPALQAGLARHLEAEALDTARWLTARPATLPCQVLLVINPTQDLPGAEAEGQQLQTLWAADPRVTLTVLAGREATRSHVLAALSTGRHELVHYAGHAMFDALDPPASGLLCARGERLRGADVAALPTPPRLLFANACESGRIRRAPASHTVAHQRAVAATGLAEAFLRAGIGHYLGTWWPVSDGPAATFAVAFHRALLAGAACGPAVLAARRAVHDTGSADWADFMHYGDPGAAVFGD